jgi:hypothetical protein
MAFLSVPLFWMTFLMAGLKCHILCKLLDVFEEPKFLANPSHQKRVFARAIYNLASAPKKPATL